MSDAKGDVKDGAGGSAPLMKHLAIRLGRQKTAAKSLVIPRGERGAEAEAPRAVDAGRVRELLRAVVDPEIGLNIVDVGLIYRIDCSPQAVRIEMTMTSPACPMSEMIIDDAKLALAEALPAGCAIDVALVWSPPWDPSMMSERGKRTLGW